MSKQDQPEGQEAGLGTGPEMELQLALHGAASSNHRGFDAPHPQDRFHSGMFGQGEVVELLKNAEGYAYGHRIRFENGMEAELLITALPTRH